MASYTDVVLLRRLLAQARPYWPHVGALFLLSLLASPLALLTPLPLKIAVDSVIGSHPLPTFVAPFVPEAITHSPGAGLALAVGIVLAIALLTQLQALGSTLLQAWVQERLVLDFRTQLFRHAQRISLAYHDTRGTADSTYRIERDAQAVQHILTEGLIPFTAATVTFVAMIYVMARIDWPLALIALAISPGVVVLGRAFRRRLRRQSRETKKLESSALSIVQEVLGALRIVKAFGQEAREEQRFLRRSGDGARARMVLARLEGSYQLLVRLTMAAGTAAVLLIGIGHVRSGALTLGELLMVMGYLAQLYEPLRTISRKAASLQLHLASAERAFALLDEAPDVEEQPAARHLARASGAIAFRNVSFAYAKDRPILHDISFEVEPGTRLGIVGATGAGKTTLISLLTRFYDPIEGQVLLDGVDLRDYRLDDLRLQLAVVLQEPVLFSVSIAENIAYAAPEASREQIIAAAQAANAHEFIERLPEGYGTQVGEGGAKLSGGQRQRIALARAFLKDSPVLILDEPTSAVDAHTEAVIVEALERLQQGRTVIIISHRAGAVASCSGMLTLEQGRLVADTHRTLAQPARAVAPLRIVSAKRRENLLAHPAVQAWRQLGPDRLVPDRITTAGRRPGVYRLEGVGAEGAAVIAKRCTRGDGLVERTVYEQILPRVPLSGPRYYGAVAEPSEDATKDACWLFIGEIQGEPYDVLRPDHRAAAARWLGILHTEARPSADLVELPDAGPGRYRRQMHMARDLVRHHLDHPGFTADDLAFLDGVLARFDQLDEHWDRLERACTGLPRTLVHGDLKGKNLRVRASPAGSQIAAFDWADSGRGVPTADLAQVSTMSRRFTASPDLATYLSVVRERWPDCDREDVERLASCGTVFRALAAIEWDSHHFFSDWANLFVPALRLYEAEMAAALDRLGWTQRSGWAGRATAVHCGAKELIPRETEAETDGGGS
jgi:ATP-binding cassette, subfamily B, bacterial